MQLLSNVDVTIYKLLSRWRNLRNGLDTEYHKTDILTFCDTAILWTNTQNLHDTRSSVLVYCLLDINLKYDYARLNKLRSAGLNGLGRNQSFLRRFSDIGVIVCKFSFPYMYGMCCNRNKQWRQINYWNKVHAFGPHPVYVLVFIFILLIYWVWVGSTPDLA
jgi:hypothetical protein